MGYSWRYLCASLAILTVVYGETPTRVVGGSEALHHRAPYQVSLQRVQRNKHFCGGSILNEQWILTAAHCLLGTDALTIRVGSNDLNDGQGELYASEKLIIHPTYNKTALTNDIGLVKVRGSIAFSPRVQPIALQRTEELVQGDSLILTGWGLTNNNGTTTNKLQEIDLEYINTDTCAKVLRRVTKTPIVDTHFCTFRKNGKGACRGDSGGPLVHNGVQVALVSWGIPCARGLPDVFTSLQPYLAFINGVMRHG